MLGLLLVTGGVALAGALCALLIRSTDLARTGRTVSDGDLAARDP